MELPRGRIVDGVQLLQRIAAGDEAALIEFHRQYVNLVFSMAFHVLQDPGESEEVTQDVFLTVWRRAGDYDPHRGSVATWLLTVARRRAIDRRRSREARPPLASELDVARLDANVPAPAALGVDLQRALAQLPAEQRQCIDLIYFGGLTHHEAAAALGVPLGTLKGRVRLAMEKLRRALLASVALL